jgi:hypothetical protein
MEPVKNPFKMCYHFKCGSCRIEWFHTMRTDTPIEGRLIDCAECGVACYPQPIERFKIADARATLFAAGFKPIDSKLERRVVFNRDQTFVLINLDESTVSRIDVVGAGAPTTTEAIDFRDASTAQFEKLINERAKNE